MPAGLVKDLVEPHPRRSVVLPLAGSGSCLVASQGDGREDAP